MEAEIRKRYQQASRRLFLLDYDGTLARLTATPEGAYPTKKLRLILQTLSQDPNNTVVIVSGRDCATLDTWLGDLPLALAAEHGTFIKDGGAWRPQTSRNGVWKRTIRPIMLAAKEKIRGATLEEKATAMVWHYRQASAKDTQPAVEELTRKLRPITQRLRLTLMLGHKIIEVKVTGANKGTAASHWLSKKKWDFILAAGDDTTDEVLFGALPKNAFGIKVGAGESRATHRLEGPDALAALLQDLTSSGVR